MKSTILLRVCVMFALAVFAVATASTADAGLFGRLRGNDCCYEPDPCCDPCCCGGGRLLSKLRGLFAGLRCHGGCGMSCGCN